MAEYHVGCGLAGIYAGTLNPKTKDGYQTWKNKSDVTEETISAVAQYLKQELNFEKNGIEITRRYTSNDGTIIELKLSIVEDMNER